MGNSAAGAPGVEAEAEAESSQARTTVDIQQSIIAIGAILNRARVEDEARARPGGRQPPNHKLDKPPELKPKPKPSALPL